MQIREEQTTGHSKTGQAGHPVTRVFDADRLLGTLRNDGFRAHDGDWVNNWSAFAGGNAVPMPAGAFTDRATALRTLLSYVALGGRP
jgi:hypothetical protein